MLIINYEGGNIMKRTISIFLVILMLLSAAPLAGIANTGWGNLFGLKAEALAASGKCGENVNYTFDSSTGTLTISGSGAMYDFSIWYSPFSYETSIKSVIISSGVTSIGDYTFVSCGSLASITIPNSVTSIGEDAFASCKSLTSITIPNSVTNIKDYAFYACESLTSITIPNSVTSVSDFTFCQCTSLTNITIPDSVMSIGKSAFYGCTSLTNITIPNSVTSIGSGAFSCCTSLKNITIPNSVTNIEYAAFSGCTSLTSINLVSGNSKYSLDSNGVLYNKDKTELLCCPAGNKRTAFSIPDSVTSIGDSAFAYCENLTSISIPDSVKSIGLYVFWYCTNLTSITIPDSVTSIERGTFEGCTSLTSVTIPDSITSIGREAFCYCSSLKSVTIPKSVTSIGIFAFDDCSALNDMYYFGTQQEWSAIDIDSNNEFLKKATIHYMNEGEVTTAASCVSDGIMTYTCTVCPATLTETIPALGHTPTAAVKEKVVSATCSKSGSYDEVVYCSACGVELSRTSKTIAKKAHTYKNIVTPATLTKDGKITPTCSVCGAKKTSTVIAKASGIKISKAKYVYNGKVQKPTIVVKDSAGKTIASKCYTATWSNSGSKAAGTYTIKVTLKGNYSGTQKLTYTIAPRQVTGLKAAAVKKDSIKVTWTKLAEAKAYKVEYSTDGKTWTSKIVTTNSFTLSKLKAGAKWQFRVTALSAAKKGVAGKVSAVLKTGTVTAAPAIGKLTSTKSKTATVTWGKVTGAKSYTVYTSTDGKTFKSVKTGVTKTTYTITGLKAGKKVYVKVQAVNAYGAKSAQSAAKTVKVKR